MNSLRFNLGGIGKGSEYRTVNLAESCDIEADITNLDSFCSDETVDEFFLSHTLEHIPLTMYESFLNNMVRKLKVGGIIKVVQTDAGEAIKMWNNGSISFRTMRSLIFTPANRCKTNILQQHQSMWSQEELIKDFESLGMKVEGFDAGCWFYDAEDDIIPDETKKDLGKQIKNLGVIATKIKRI